MTIESATYISDLNSSNPGAGDSLVEGDDHIKLIKSTVKASFPNITGAMTATHTQLNAIGMFLIQSQSASSSATIDFTTSIDSTYEEYELHIINAIPATNTVEAWLRTTADGGSSYAASSGDYDYMIVGRDGGGGVGANGGTTATKLLLSSTTVHSTADWGGVSAVIRFFDPAATASYKRFMWDVSLGGNNAKGNIGVVQGAGTRAATAAINGVRFMFSSGNIASGKFKLYGIRKS